MRLFPLARRAIRCSLLATTVLLSGSGTAQVDHLVISQVYGAGGNSGATFNRDFIEIFNPTGSAVSLAGMSVQYASSTGTSWTNITPLSGSIPSGGYFLIGGGSGSNGAALPAVDVSGTINMSGTSGKVILINQVTSASAVACPTTNVIDHVSFGAAASSCNGSATGTLSVTLAAIRKEGGCTDTDDNASDFTTALPSPRNSASAVHACGVSCAITLGTASTTCNSSTIGDTDTYSVSLPYSGVSAGVAVVYSGTGTVGGDDPAATSNGTIVVSNIPETEGYTISLSAPCASQVSSGSAPACDPVCGVTFGTALAVCNSATAGNSDTYNVSIPYSGVEPGVTITYGGSGTVGGDHPSTISGGTILISGIPETEGYSVSLSAPCGVQVSNGSAPACDPEPTIINFDVVGNWTAGSAALGSYASDHSYTSNDWSFTGGPALRNGTTSQDGFPGAFGTYSWRMNTNTIINWRATYQGSDVLSSFGFKVRRWDNNPDPNYSVTYSTDGGTSWSASILTINNATLLTSDWYTFSYAVPSPAAYTAGQFIVRVASGATGERIMIDDFTFVSEANPCSLVVGTASTTCEATTLGVDTYTLTIPYTGAQAGAVVLNNSGSGTISGDDPTAVVNGTIIITGITEGSGYNVTFGAPCDALVINGASPSCVPSCVISLGTATATCNSVTAGDTDTYHVSVPYTGSQAGVTVTYSGMGTVGGDDPAVVANGTIVINNIPETEGYTLSLSSPCNTQVSSGTAPACDPGPLAAWDFTGEANLATSAAEVFDSNLDASNLITRGPNAGPSAGANSFRTTGFSNNGIATSNGDYFQVTLSAVPNKALSLSSINAHLRGTATFADPPGVSQQFAYSLDGSTFTLIGAPIVTIGASGIAVLPEVDLSSVAALQNVAPSTTITLRYYASGQTATGGWGFTSSTAGEYGLAIGGTLVDVANCDVTLGTPVASCNSITSGPNDTYDVSIPYTGVHPAVTVQNNSGSGTVGGDDPATTPNGTIVITGISESDDFAIALSGDCSVQTAFGLAPVCEPPPVLPTLVINEVDYDQPGDDLNEFIEIMNTGAEPVNLNGLKVVLVNGGNGQSYAPFITLGNVVLAAGDYYVIGSANVPNVDLAIFNATLPLNQNLAIQNGAPDGIRLTTADDTVIDQLSYEGAMSTTEGTSAPTDAGSTAGVGLSRMPNGADTNDNSADFVLICVTPGASNGGVDTDGDGTPDCLDVCPGGPEPGTPCNDENDQTANDVVGSNCICAGVLMDCEGTLGGTALPGTDCDDGNPGTLDDVYQADCTCAGVPLDCYGIPGGPNVPGAPCNDGIASTNDETIDAFCTCVGTPCSQNVVIDLRSDVNSDQISWEILYQNDGTVVCSGGNYIGNVTEPIVEPCCLPIGCFRLRVSDSGGDGFVGGGYQLRESGSNGRRIIDNFGNFTNGAISALNPNYDNGAFCVPVGSDKLLFSSCDKLDWVENKFIVAHANAAVTAEFGVTNATSGYEFWFFDANGGYSFRRFRSHATSDGYGSGATRACHFKVNGWSNSIATPHIPGNTLLNVRVRGRVAGNNLPFGAACLFKIDPTLAACPRVKLQDDPANTSDFSCGVFRNFGGGSNAGNRIYANPPQPIPLVASSSVRYQFRFRIRGEAICIVRPPQTSAQMTLNWTNGPALQCSKTYEVDVRVSLNGGATWCFGPAGNGQAATCADTEDWGKVCNVTINPCAQQAGGNSNITTMSDGVFTMYPNPNSGDQLFLNLSSVEAGVSTVSVDIFELTGKRVVARTIAVQPFGPNTGGYVNTNMDLNGQLANGLYLVHITAGGSTFTERLVVQR